jgi:hypothetical protein
MNLFQGGAIDVNMLLENTSFPFATKLLESLKRKQADAAQVQQAMMEAQSAAASKPMSAQMQMAMNNNNAGSMDGVIQKA